MADLTGFNANDVVPLTSFDPIPPGKYVAVITGSEMKRTRAGTGRYLELAFQIIEGEHKGRFVWTRLNLDNPNTVAVRIAQAELSAICRAVGVLAPRDSVELHNLPLVIDVQCRKRIDTGEIKNVIKGYFPKTTATGAAGKSDAVPDNGNMATPPWKR